MRKVNVLSSFLEPPKDTNSDLHPLKPWVLTAVDNGESNMITVAIYDYKNKRTIVSLCVNTSAPQPVAPFASVGTHHTTYPAPNAKKGQNEETPEQAIPGIVMATKDDTNNNSNENDENNSNSSSAATDNDDNNNNNSAQTSRKSHLRNTISFGAKTAGGNSKQAGPAWCGADTFATDYGFTAASLIGVDCPENAAQIPTNTFIYPECMKGKLTKFRTEGSSKASEAALKRGAPFLPTPGSLDLTSSVDGAKGAAFVSSSSSSSSNTAAEISGVQKACGNLRVLKFYDSHVRSYKAVVESQNDLQRTGTEAKLNTETRFDCCGNYGVLVFDYRVVFVDYVTMKTREIGYSEMKSFQITSVEIFSKYRFIAFGCSDGSTRLFDTERWNFFKVLSGGHKQNACITKLFSIVRDDTTWLLSLGSDGAIAVWNVFTGTLEKTFPEAHSGGATEITFDPSSGRIFTYGNDKNIVGWEYGEKSDSSDKGTAAAANSTAAEGDGDASAAVDEETEDDKKKDKKKKKKEEESAQKKKKIESVDTGNAPFREALRTQVKTGKNVAGFHFLFHPDYPPNSFICFQPDTADVYVSDSAFSVVQKVFSVNDVKIISPIALKRLPKIYSLSVHPLQKNVIVVGSSRGTFLIKVPYTQ